MNVSVIVATFGSLEWEQLAHDRAVPSVEAQTLEPHSVVRVHLAEGTLAESRNLGAEDASGDWLCFLDADDELAPGYLDAMADVERRVSYPLLLVPAVQYVREYDSRAGLIRKVEDPVVLNTGRPLYEINRAVIGTLVPRRLFLEVGGFPEMPALEDWAMFLACERAGAKLVDVPDAVYRAWIRTKSRNSDQSLYRQIRSQYERPADVAIPVCPGCAESCGQCARG